MILLANEIIKHGNRLSTISNTLLNTNGKKESLEYAIAHYKLIDTHILPDDPIVDPTDDYWDSFKPTVKQHRS